jgi:hypothetical protein
MELAIKSVKIASTRPERNNMKFFYPVIDQMKNTAKFWITSTKALSPMMVQDEINVYWMEMNSSFGSYSPQMTLTYIISALI